MAFELAEIDPTSVPINLLNPRTGTKFGDRELMDPWEVVKWVAIFRLILPDALFRLCGGRVENLGELQPLAVKAGLNGVMMGNFLTTLGVEPAEDRAMFEELGLTSPASPTTAPTRAPTTAPAGSRARRPRTPIDELIDSQAEANFWDPSTQLRVIKKKGKPSRRIPSRARRRLAAMSDVAERLAELRALGAPPATAADRGPAGAAGAARRRRGAAALLEQLPRARRPPDGSAAAAAEAAERYGAGAGASRLISGSMALHRRLEQRLAAFKGTEAALLFGSRLPGQHRRRLGARRPRRGRLLRRAQPREHHRRLPALAAPRPSSTATATSSTSPGACARPASGRG